MQSEEQTQTAGELSRAFAAMWGCALDESASTLWLEMMQMVWTADQHRRDMSEDELAELLITPNSLSELFDLEYALWDALPQMVHTHICA